MTRGQKQLLSRSAFVAAQFLLTSSVDARLRGRRVTSPQKPANPVGGRSPYGEYAPDEMDGGGAYMTTVSNWPLEDQPMDGMEMDEMYAMNGMNEMGMPQDMMEMPEDASVIDFEGYAYVPEDIPDPNGLPGERDPNHDNMPEFEEDYEEDLEEDLEVDDGPEEDLEEEDTDGMENNPPNASESQSELSQDESVEDEDESSSSSDNKENPPKGKTSKGKSPQTEAMSIQHNSESPPTSESELSQDESSSMDEDEAPDGSNPYNQPQQQDVDNSEPELYIPEVDEFEEEEEEEYGEEINWGEEEEGEEEEGEEEYWDHADFEDAERS